MNNWKLPAIGLLSALILATPLSVQAETATKSVTDDKKSAQQDNQAAARQLASLLKPLQTIRADFVQQTLDNSGRQLEQNTGNMIVKRPNFFRWDVTEPFPQLVVSNGTRVWLYDKDLEQVTIQKLDTQVNATPALILSGDTDDITKNFAVTKAESDDRLMFTLNPLSKDNLFENLQLVFRVGPLQNNNAASQNWLLTQMLLTDSLGARTRIDFSNLKFNETLQDKTFELYIPPGVDVIEDNQ